MYKQSICSKIQNLLNLNQRKKPWHRMKKIQAFGGNSCLNNESLDTNSLLFISKNKLSVEILQDDTEEKISNYIKSGIFNFGLDLFFGSVEQNVQVIDQLKNLVNRESKLLGFSIPLSIYLKLSPRLQYTGRFKRNKRGVNLKLHRQVILTTNREYASRSCHSFIYVNAKFLMVDVRKCDIICLGKYIQLQVVEANISDHVVCKVIVPGFVKSRMLVRFPKYIEEAHSKISAEELEDITFAIGTNINVIISHIPGNTDYCNDLRDTLAELKCNMYLFTRVTLDCLDNLEDANRISGAYDGFLLDCSEKAPHDEIIKLSPGAKAFMEKSYRKRKPIFLQGCWSYFIDRSEYQYAFQYPDKFILPCEPQFLHLFEAVFHKLLQTQFLEKHIHTQTLSSSSTLARSIVAASFDFQADAIVIRSTVGEMAIKISHFRPKAVIVSITSLRNVVNYSSMHHNIWMLAFDVTELSHKEETHQKLVYGLQYALLKNLVHSSSTVILVYGQRRRYGSTDKFAIIKIDNDYAETIRNVILN